MAEEAQNPFDLPQAGPSNADILAQLYEAHGQKPNAVPIYLKVTGAKETGGDKLKLGTYVNPALAVHSDYFGKLDKMLKCVERNAALTDPAAQERACAKEYKALRLSAFGDELMYHQVNKRWFMHEIQYKARFSAF